MNRQELMDLVAGGERPGVEFKNARAYTDSNFWEVAKAVLAMANHRDGGMVLVGVLDDGTVTGLSAPQVEGWRNVDAVRQALGPFADPFVYVDIDVVDVATAANAAIFCAVIVIKEFDQVPVLLARSITIQGRVVLTQGACLIRSRQLPATTQIADHAAFRELLDIAIDKGVRVFLRRARQAGLALGARFIGGS